MTVRSLTIRPRTAAAAVAFAVLGGSAFSHVETSTTISRAVLAPVADVAMATPLAASSAQLPADGGNGGNGGWFGGSNGEDGQDGKNGKNGSWFGGWFPWFATKDGKMAADSAPASIP